MNENGPVNREENRRLNLEVKQYYLHKLEFSDSQISKPELKIKIYHTESSSTSVKRWIETLLEGVIRAYI